MKKKNIPVYIVGSLVVALVGIMVLLTFALASGSFRLRKTKLVIRTGSDEKEYDGTPLTCDEWHLIKGKLSPEHELAVEVRGKQTRAGISDNYADVTVYDKGGLDVTDQYDIEIDAGKLEVTKKKVTIESYSGDKVYDGKEYSYTYAKVTKGRITRGHKLVTTDFAVVTDPGKYPNTFVANIYDENGEDISDRYEITYVYGELNVKSGVLRIESGSASKEYDGTPISNTTWKLAEGKIANGHELVVSCIGSLTTVGNCTNTLSVKVLDKNGADVTESYEIVKNEGMLTVTPRTIVIKTSDIRRKVGSAPVTDDWALVDGTLADGETLSVRTSQQYDSGYSSGSYDNTAVRIEVKSDGTTENLARCYQIIVQYGRYEITE